MGIKYPPSDLAYPFPKGIGRIGVTKGKVLGRVTQIEPFKDWGDYMRVIDWVKFNDGHRELRFAQFYRKPGGGEKDWKYGQGAGYMSSKTFYKLIRKAQTEKTLTEPDYGSFRGAFDRFRIK